MKSTRFFRNFVFLFSLLGLGSFAWGERYETVFVYTDDTETLDNSAARVYLQSSECVSTQSLTLQQGETATVFASGAIKKPNGTIALGHHINDALVYKIIVDIDGLEANITKGPELKWNSSDYSKININDSIAGNIVGPAIVRIVLKPFSARHQPNTSGYTGVDYWSLYQSTYITDWDFQASEGFVTFKISGAEEAPSKKFATVIPENASGNIRVVLEQSTDLINWTSATPGVFAPSTSKRFFRVRSEEE